MTVKEVVGLLKTAKTIALGYSETAVEFNKEDPLMMDAYGNYMVSSIHCTGDDYYEVNIAMRPVRKGEAM
jgi:hypothetical protein